MPRKQWFDPIHSVIIKILWHLAQVNIPVTNLIIKPSISVKENIETLASKDLPLHKEIFNFMQR